MHSGNPEQARNLPNLPRLTTIGLPQVGQISSVSSVVLTRDPIVGSNCNYRATACIGGNTCDILMSWGITFTGNQYRIVFTGDPFLFDPIVFDSAVTTVCLPLGTYPLIAAGHSATSVPSSLVIS